MSFHNLEALLDGELDDLVSHLVLQSQAQAFGEPIPNGSRARDVEL
jgi:hypothetical protein